MNERNDAELLRMAYAILAEVAETVIDPPELSELARAWCRQYRTRLDTPRDKPY